MFFKTTLLILPLVLLCKSESDRIYSHLEKTILLKPVILLQRFGRDKLLRYLTLMQFKDGKLLLVTYIDHPIILVKILIFS